MRYILLLLLCAANLFANNITAVEYSWDTPAPAGTGAPLTVAAPGAQVNVVQNIPINALSAGLHQLFIRAYDDSAGWGSADREWIFKYAPVTTSNREVLELQIGFDGNVGTVYDVPDASSVQLIRNVPIAALTNGLHYVNVRARDNFGNWSQIHSEWIYKYQTITPSNREVLELQIGFDGSVGAIHDVPDASTTQLIRNIAVDALTNGLHYVNVRARDNFGVWSSIHSEWFYKFPQITPSNREVLELQVGFDGNVGTVYDVPDASLVQMIRNIAVNTLTNGLHYVNVRARDNFGNWGQIHGEWFYKFAPAANDTLNVTQVELQVDAQPATYHDVTDSSFANLIAHLPASAMGYGTHTICARYQDERGIWSSPDCRRFFVMPGSLDPNAGHIAGGECWVNADPGEGNGLPLLPSDGVWDELNESAYITMTDSVPMGLHVVGVRLRNDLGQWSNVALDTVTVGPLLVINSNGSDIVLSWTQAPQQHDWSIWRGTMPAGVYNIIGTTTASTYTDPGVTNAIVHAHYHVTFATTPGVLSDFRLPSVNGAKE